MSLNIFKRSRSHPSTLKNNAFSTVSTLETVRSNSLIFHKEKTKEIINVTVVWMPDLNNLTFFSKNYEWLEKPYQKLDRNQVSKPGIQAPQSGLKNLGCASFLQPTSRCLDILMKNSFSCLICYFKVSVCR